MVKNFGGNKSKRIARKYINTNSNTNTRKAEKEGEIYGIITKLYGNGRAEVLCIDNISRILIIRKKFKGRNKRNNNVALNTWVLAGLRLWEVIQQDSKETCDLLEVYDSSDIEFLKSNVEEDWKIFGTEKQSEDDSDYIDFNDKMEEADFEANTDSSNEDENNSSNSDFDIDDL